MQAREEQLAEIERLGKEYLQAFRQEMACYATGALAKYQAAKTEKAWANYTAAMLAVLDTKKEKENDPY